MADPLFSLLCAAVLVATVCLLAWGLVRAHERLDAHQEELARLRDLLLAPRRNGQAVARQED